MKIQCNVCEAAEARVLCCADEAALCYDCDEKVHAANKLAGKHQRVPLSASSSNMPCCDICQDTVGYFFCLEDRALLCRKCDLAIHTANAFVSGHQRFLLTGVKVGLESAEPPPPLPPPIAHPLSSGKALFEERRSETKSSPASKRPINPIPSIDHEYSVSNVNGVLEDLAPPAKVSFAGGSMARSIPQWQVDEYIGLGDCEFHPGYGSSKADRGKLGESESPVLRSAEEDFDDDECLGEALDSSWTVPQIPSPPTASGLYWPRSLYNSPDYAVFVPEISYSRMQNGTDSQSGGSPSKRQRRF